SLPLQIAALADRFESAPALVSAETQLTYRSLSAQVNRYARWARAQGLTAGDVVCLLMTNCPEYMAVWLGLTRAGITVSLLNTNLTGEALAHGIRIVAARGVIVGSSLCDAIQTARAHLDPGIRYWQHGATNAGPPSIDLEIARLSADPLPDSRWPAPALEDRALYIYTSGTTGLPKAATVSHLRILQWAYWFAGMMNTGPNDRMYNCLPMYHSIGGIVATGALLVNGGTVVVRERFSAHEFWKDIVKERCTLFQYIGELCRYLLSTERQPEETRHVLRLCCGNGLRGDVWEQFQARFQIPQILEYYASTEGSFSLYNCEGRPGAIGKIPPFLSHRVPVALVKFDPATEMPARDQSGFCTRCDADEVGEALGQIRDAAGHPGGRFEGYADPQASSRKLLRNVFETGDLWYRTGDLMRRDAQGFFYFVDRVGDTFRWKGENVSTTEVASVISSCPGVLEVAVYGVSVPGTEGRAGMASLVVNGEFDLVHLRDQLSQKLPPYARPVFIRLVSTIERTGTFRLRKAELAAQGFDPAQAGEIYADDRASGSYVRLDTLAY